MPVTGLDSPRLQALLTYLVLNRAAPHPRQQLAFSFWPDSAEPQARTNLRNLIHRLREALPNLEDFIKVETKTLWFQPNAPYVLDLEEFEKARIKAEKARQSKEQQQLRSHLETAAANYGGDLLPSCYDDWIIPERERLSSEYSKVLKTLIILLQKEGKYSEAIEFNKALLRQDPLVEETYRSLMNLYAKSGETARAAQTYHRCADTLEKELGLEPGSETRLLYQELLERDKKTVETQRVTEKSFRLKAREKVWSILESAWKSSQNLPQLALILGEAGIGKTYLAEDFTRWLKGQGINTLRTRSFPTGSQLVYAPLSNLLRQEKVRIKYQTLTREILTELSRLLPELKAQFPDLPEPELMGENWQRQRLFESSAQALLKGESKLVILLDDLQWFDQESLDWLHYLLTFEKSTQLLLLGTVRSEDLVADNPVLPFLIDLNRGTQVTEIILERLDQDGTHQLASELWGEKLNPEETTRLFQETEGNPLFIAEMIRAGFIPQARDSLKGWTLPPRVQAVIEARLSVLSPTAQDLAGIAAVVGHEFNFDLLNLVSERDSKGTLEDMDELWNRRIIQELEPEGYSFQHDKFQEVVYQNLSPPRKEYLHGRIAAALEELDPDQLKNTASQLAYHYLHAGKSEQALDYYLLAGDQARALYAREESAAHYQAAENLLEKKKDPRQVQLYEGWGNALLKLARYQEAADRFQLMASAADRFQNQLAQSQAWLAIGKVYDRQGEFQEALVSAEKAVKLAKKHSFTEELADGKLLQGQQYYRLGHVDQAKPLIQEALDLHHRNDNQFGVGRCLSLLGLVADVEGEFSRAKQIKKETIQVFEDLDHPQSEWWIGNITLNLAITFDLEGNYQDAVNLYGKALDIMEEINDRDWKITCLFNLGAAQVSLGDYDQAEDHLGQVLALTEGSNWMGLSLTYYYLAESYLGQNQLKYGQKAALEALELAQRSGAQEHLGAAWRALGKTTSLTGEDIMVDDKAHQAVECFQKSRDIFDNINAEAEKAYTLRVWAEHENQIGNKKTGIELWEEAKQIFKKLEMTAEVERMESKED